jgi:hypothetical protein
MAAERGGTPADVRVEAESPFGPSDTGGMSREVCIAAIHSALKRT